MYVDSKSAVCELVAKHYRIIDIRIIVGNIYLIRAAHILDDTFEQSRWGLLFKMG